MAIFGRWENGEWKGLGWPTSNADAPDPRVRLLCLCGCGLLATAGNRYVFGHKRWRQV